MMEKKDRKEGRGEIDWERLDELASYGVKTWTESFLAQMADRMDTYIREGGLDRDIAELDSMFVDEDLDERIKARWVPESSEAWISSTASGKPFVGSIVAKLANRENHTVMDTLRQELYLMLLRAEGDMRARRDASSVRRRIKGGIPRD